MSMLWKTKIQLKISNHYMQMSVKQVEILKILLNFWICKIYFFHVEYTIIFSWFKKMYLLLWFFFISIILSRSSKIPFKCRRMYFVSPVNLFLSLSWFTNTFPFYPTSILVWILMDRKLSFLINVQRYQYSKQTVRVYW